MGCRKNSPGTPCCCVECCITRVEVDLAVPDEGEPGASLGTFGWDIVDEPYLAEHIESGEKVCEYTYVAPQINICSPDTYLVNATYPQINRLINADALFCAGQGANQYTGTNTWKSSDHLRNASFKVAKRGSMVKCVFSAEILREYIVYPTPGGVLNSYDIFFNAYCVEDFSLEYTNDYETSMCPGLIPSNNFCPNTVQPNFQIVGGFYVVNVLIDSGWVEGDCESLPTDISVAARWSDYDADYPNTDNACRIPSGSTPSNPGLGCACGTNVVASNTYDPFVEWTCTHTFRVTLCT